MRKINLCILTLVFITSGASSLAAPSAARVPLMKLRDRGKVTVIADIRVPLGDQFIYFQEGNQVSKKEIDKSKAYCSIHVGRQAETLNKGKEIELAGGSYFQSYLSSAMIYAKLGGVSLGQIFCEKPSPKNYLDRRLQFSVKDFNDVFANHLKIDTVALKSDT